MPWNIRTLLLATLCTTALPHHAPAQTATGGIVSAAAPIRRPTFLQPEENNLLWGNPVPPTLRPVDTAAANQFWRTLQDERIEHRYIVGSCEDRTQYINLMLRRAGIASGKVWVIAPARYTLLSRELIAVQDPYGIAGSVTWGHHVAPIIEREHERGVDTLVIDPSFSPGGYLTLGEWLERLNTPRSVFFLTGPDDYLFNSADGLNVYHNGSGLDPVPVHSLPPWFPNVLTGDFQPYTYQYKGREITGGMATNDVALQIFSNALPRVATAAERDILAAALRWDDAMDALLGSEPYEGLSNATLSAIRGYYRQRVRHWDGRLRALSGGA